MIDLKYHVSAIYLGRLGYEHAREPSFHRWKSAKTHANLVNRLFGKLYILPPACLIRSMAF
jgi:hypothetical protein